MSYAYIDDTGFHRARLDEILADLIASYQGIYGADIDVAPDSPDGQWLGVLAEKISDNCQTLEDIYNSLSPSGARGATLKRLVRLNGMTAKGDEFSTATVTVTGTNGTLVPAGTRIASDLDSTAIFATLTDITIAGGAGSAQAQAVNPGPINVSAGHLTVKLVVINGWDSVTNALAAAPGALAETDAEIRIRRAASVALPSQGILDGLRAALLQIDSVSQVVVRENNEDTTQTLADGGPLAPHAIQVIIRGGDPSDNGPIAETMWAHAAPGCTMVGATTATIVDSQGTIQTLKFDRPMEVPIYVTVNTTTALTSDQKDAVRKAIVDRGNGVLVIGDTPVPGSQIGEDVAVSTIYDAITYLRVTSMPMLRVDAIDISNAPSPTSDAEVPIAYNELATWDPTNVQVLP